MPVSTLKQAMTVMANSDYRMSWINRGLRESSMNDVIPDWATVQAAREFLKPYFAPTRLLMAPSLTKADGPGVYLKLESDLPTRSFKVRGALYALHAEMARRRVTEVVASSTGNHGAAVAWAGKSVGIPAKIFLPCGANPVKQFRICALGADIVEHGKDISDAAEAAAQYTENSDAFYLNDATNSDIPAGTATIACEIFEQLPEVAAVWVPMGDTALIRGVASAAKHIRPGIRVVGVQAERAPAYYLSWTRGVPVPTSTCDTVADGLATRTPIRENVTAIRALVDEVRLVTETQMLAAIRHLLIEEHLVAEPAGAATTGAYMADSLPARYGPLVLLLSGANVSEAALRQAVGEPAVNPVDR
jgi:threonine dehydratase